MCVCVTIKINVIGTNAVLKFLASNLFFSQWAFCFPCPCRCVRVVCVFNYREKNLVSRLIISGCVVVTVDAKSGRVGWKSHNAFDERILARFLFRGEAV